MIDPYTTYLSTRGWAFHHDHMSVGAGHHGFPLDHHRASLVQKDVRHSSPPLLQSASQLTRWPCRNKNVSQIADRSPRRGDLIITNYTSYIDTLYLAYRYNPTFLLPVFAPLEQAPLSETTRTGRHTGTGSANIATAPVAQPAFLGYLPITLLALLGRTGDLPPTFDVIPTSAYKTLKAARRAEKRPVVLLAEGTTSNGRAVLKLPEGVLDEGDIGGDDEGIVWLKFFRSVHPFRDASLSMSDCDSYCRHTPASASASSATSPLPLSYSHLFSMLSAPLRSVHVRTLHPAHSPSSPSFLPSEILSGVPGGYDGVGKDGRGAWREAIAVTLAELGRVRRVRGMGWVEKSAFLEYYNKRARR